MVRRGLGAGFADAVWGGVGKPSLTGGERISVSGKGWTVMLFTIPLVCGFLAVLVRLVWLMLVFGPVYRELSNENRIKVVPLPARRGVIYDRNGEIIAANRPVYRVKRETGGGEAVYETISRKDALLRIADFKDADLIEDVGRDYRYGVVMAHILGYLGQATREEVEKNDFKGLDLLGRSGVEELYDSGLRGRDGARLLEVDTGGEVLREIGREEPVAGRDLRLTVDVKLSEKTYEALGGLRAAVVVENPETGEILVMVSSPSFDPGVFSGGSGEEVRAVLDGKDRPLFNRAISGQYPPGSTYKIVSAMAGLENSVISADFKYEDKGFVVLGNQTFNNWLYTQHGRTEGVINVVGALTRSTDTFFYKLGELVGVEKLAGMSRKFGLGDITGVDLPGEATGLVPDPKWKLKVKGERWFLGDSLIMAIGQGNLLVTPLQVNQMGAVVASGGLFCRPRVVEGENNCHNLGFKKENVDLVKQGMYAACAKGGTAYPLFDFPKSGPEQIAVACKTGTAEYGDPKGRTHAWLTAFVEGKVAREYGREPVVVTVLVESGGEGSGVAAPIVRKILASYFDVEDKYNYSLGGEEVVGE